MSCNRKTIRGGVLAALFALFVGILCLSPAWADEAHAETIDVIKTINASKATDTSGMSFTFDVEPAAVISGEEGAQPVPRYDSNNDGSVDSSDDYVMPADKTIQAGSMTADVKTINDTIALPDPALFGRAGVYSYTVVESQAGKPSGWTYSAASYRVRLYVKNGSNGLEYASQPLTIETLTDDAGTAVAHEQGSDYGPKVQAMLFTNTCVATTDIRVLNTVDGPYADRTYAFPFTLTINLPSWADDATFDLSGTLPRTRGVIDTVTTENGTATISFDLADGQWLKVNDLPVGTTFTAVETNSVQGPAGANVYTPSATYDYDGDDGTAEGFDDNRTSYAEGVAANSDPTHSVTVFAESETVNESTTLGAGRGNLVTMLNVRSAPVNPTGIMMASAPYIALALIAAAFLIVLRTRRKDEEIA